MNNFEEADEIEFIDHDMEFSSILDIPLYAQIRSSLHAFFAKIHATISIPSIIGSIYIFILSMQSLFPSFLIDCHELWPKNNFLTPVFQILGTVWVGPSTNENYTRVLISYLFAILFLLAFLFLVIRALIYKKHMRIYPAEIWACYIIFKFIFPLICPHIVHSLPLVIENLIYQRHLAVSILAIIFNPIAAVIYLFLVYSVIFPRVLFENLPTHEWLPALPLAYILNTSLQALYSVSASVVHSKVRLIFPILMFIQSAACGIVVYFLSSVLKRSVCVVVGSIAFTSAVISLIQCVNLEITNHIKPEVIFIIFVCLIVLFYILLRLLDTRLTIGVMSFFDTCELSPQNANEILEERMKNPHIFIAYVRFTLSQCHPFISSMEAFNFALHKWPEDTNLLLFYGRILAMFPWRNNQMAYVASLLSKQSGSRSYTSFLLQFRHISRTRQTLLTNRIKRQIEEIRSQCDTLKRIIKRFWENILQKNTNAFWDDVNKVKRRIKDIENILQKMCEDYPNNESVILEQIKYVSTIKKDFIEESAIRERLQKLRTEGFIKADTSFSIASKVFPIFCSQAEVYESPENSNEKLDIGDNNQILINSNEIGENDSTSISDRNRKIAVQQSIERSPLGRVWPVIIYLTITTCLCIAIYLVFHFTYVQRFITKELNAISFLTTLNKAIYEINSMCFYITVFPSAFPGYKSSLPPDFMEKISPSLYPKYIPYFNLTADFISRHNSAAGQYMSEISNMMANLDNDNDYVQSINFLLTKFELDNNLTVKATVNQMLIDSKSILFYNEPKSYYESDEYLRLGTNYILLLTAFTDMSFVATTYASTISSKSNNLLNNLMVLSITVNLAFISLPFILSLFRLQLQSDSIAVSFSYLPNTEIRSIINEYGASASKNDEDMNSISRLTQSIPLHSTENIKKIIVFCFTFLPVFVCSLVTYYYSFIFTDQTQRIAMKIYTLYPAFAEMKSGVGFLIRVAQIDTDPDNFLPSREDRDEILIQSILILYISMTSFSKGMWGEIAGADAYYNPKFQDDVKIDKFEYVFNSNLTTKVPKSFTYFEQFAIEGLLRCIDVIFGYSLSYLTEHMDQYFNPCYFDDNFVLSLFYWFGSFNYINRTQVYFKLVEKSVEVDIQHYRNNEDAIMGVSLGGQVFALFLIILYLLQLHYNIRGSLQFYQYINPQVLLENQNIVLLIEDEKRTIEKANSSFFNVEYTVEMDPKGIVIVDSNLSIIKNNPAFRRIIQPQNQSHNRSQEQNDNQNQNQLQNENDQNQNPQNVTNLNLYLNPIKNEINNIFENFVHTFADDLKGQQLTDFILNVDSNHDNQNNSNINMIDNVKNNNNSDDDENEILEGSWTDFIFHLNECVSGKFKPRFLMNVSGKTIDNRPLHLTCNVIAMNSEGAVEEGDVSQVEKIAIIFEDCTQFFVRKQMITQEQSLAQDLLKQVLPSRLAHSFMDADYEGFSFVVQTATIGCLDVHFDNDANDKVAVSKEKLQLASDLLKIFDEEIGDFDLLCKVRSFGTTFVFAGGLISDMNKPERHAEQAAKYALKMIALVEDLSKKTNYDIKLTAGIHTGGPIVAGVIENQKPIFQVIGSVMEIASQMTMTDVPNQVQVTRAVYELVFTAGFHIIERGDTEIRGGQTLTTYLINPK